MSEGENGSICDLVWKWDTKTPTLTETESAKHNDCDRERVGNIQSQHGNDPSHIKRETPEKKR